MIHIKTMQLGPVMTNTYLVADQATKEAVVIDPAWDGHLILAEAEKLNWQIRQVWVTHAHFDHFGGAGAIVKGLAEPPIVALHSKDRMLWLARGGAPLFGVRFESTTKPTLELVHGQRLALGENTVEVRHAPGHTTGHVMFYFIEAGVLFSGDVIFQGSVGRTDLPGGSWNTLLKSIQTQVLTLPDEVRILSGHGPETTVGEERQTNPFVLYG
jgi:glyoxylase-like metal-dependent hydrolase (beta-lactamase superfamily II)